MSVGNPNLTGIPPRVAPPPVRGGHNPANPATQSARQMAMNKATANTPAPLPAVPTGVTAPGVTSAPAVGGTTAPTQGARTAQPVNILAQTALQMAQAAMATPALLGQLAGVAFGTARTRVQAISGDDNDLTGDVDRTESEEQPDALQETDQEQGSGEINEANTTNGPST